ncbi:rhamnose ABC transporter substrate-binding protein [Trinickia diaoshuihuensis]|jgi:rhamnose transport system substrate-binding protein|uniref:rhamnose ABC transporter substrate-binding protein n=1 Tax=Trinickia diaoshuihuensis TaxID=2292265 RepID=UPI000E2483BD|nr:rhamnose ABC transporter substrate-binding protein [Trinickia diaoshuihuensis]
MRKALRAAAAATCIGMLFGLASTAGAAGIKDGLKVAFVPKQINNPYEVTADNGGLAAIKEFKGDGKVVGPSDAGASSQVQYINTLTTQHVDAIVIAANDPNAVVPYLKRAMERGIKVVTFDSDTAPAGRQVFVNQTNAENIGRAQIQLTAGMIGNEGEFAILSATPNATNQNTWIGWMKEELKKPEYAKMKLVKIAYGNDDDQQSFVETQGLLQAYPNLKAIIAPTSVGLAAAARYISSSPSKGKVVVTGLGTPNQMREFVKNGTVKAFQLWDPGQLGYLAAYAAANLASGAISGKPGETFSAGKLGTRTIGKDGEVILGPPQTFNAGNIDKFNF